MIQLLQPHHTDRPGLILLGVAGFAAWILYRILKNCFWHPLSNFPGPRIGAISTLYRAYIDCVAKSSFVHTLEKLHAKYGKPDTQEYYRS